MATPSKKKSQGKKSGNRKKNAQCLKYSQKSFLQAVHDTGGIISSIAEKLGCSRQTCYDYIARFPKIAQAVEDERQRVGDLAEGALFNQLSEGNITAIMFYLKTKHSDRGYVEKQHIEQETTMRRVVFVAPEQFESPEEWAKKHKNS